MFIFIQCPNGRTLTIEIVKTDTIRNLKHKITEKEEYEVNCQILKLNGIELQDARTIESCGIEAETSLILSIVPYQPEGSDLFQFFVIIPGSNNSQRTSTIKDLTKQSTGLDLLRKIHEMEDKPIEELKAVFGGKTITHETLYDKTLEELEFYNECSVFLTFRIHGGINL